MDNDSPRGIGFTWESTQTKIIQYEKKLATKGYKYATDKEWFDHMQITAKKMEDSVSEHFLYTISHKKWNDIVGDDYKQLKAIIDKQCAMFKRQSKEAQAEIERIKKVVSTLALATTPISEIILRKIAENKIATIPTEEMPNDVQIALHEQKIVSLKEEIKWNEEQIKSMPPKHCPPTTPIEHLEGSLMFESNVLKEEWDKGLHMWTKYGSEFKPSWMDLCRWASHKYTIEGKVYKATSWYNSQKSSNSRTNTFSN